MFEISQIRNVIFDFGGVLFEIDYDLPVKAFYDLGFRDFAELYTQAAQNPVFDQLETGKMDDGTFMNYLHSFVPSATRQQIEEAWNSILLYIMPDQVEFVRRVRSKGLRTFLLSNTNAIHVKVFEKMIAEKMDFSLFSSAFEKIYYSNVIGIKKPYPETFLEVCSWNQLNPAETLFVDDSWQHVEGASAAGLHTFHLQKGQKLNEALDMLLS